MHSRASTALLVGAFGLVHGVDTSRLNRPDLGSVPYGINVDRCTVPGKAAITFDDGPNIYTKELLDILGSAGVKATFFLSGSNGQATVINDPKGPYPEMVKRMHREGHQIASHSWSHQDFVKISADQRAQELTQLESAFVDILGFFPTYFRPPYTSFEGIEGDLATWGYHNINFDLDTEDFKENYDNSRSIVRSALAQKGPAGGSFITLLHDIHPQSVTELLPWLIEEARKYNYEFVTVGECLGDPVNNWYRDPTTGGPFGGPAPMIKVTSSSSSSSSESMSSSSTTTSASKPSASESTKSNSTMTTGSGLTTVTSTSTTQGSKTATTAATSTPTPKPNAAGRVEAAGWMLLGALGVFAWL